uniref:NADH-ubiquinone oxidoreductase chain 5 n=1 Tax=Drawida japonica TaxID=408826 RepID=A0A0N6YRE4_9ANNE|nr:NADH dehydrogenase subunit 5 [Drawida japonica]AIR76350.1 NADH dehydrogenase subunit 5 [Drawida japonica]
MFKLHKIANYTLWILFTLLMIPTALVVFNDSIVLLEWNLLSVYSTPLFFTLILDPYGMVFSCAVIMISANVLQFSKVYMEEDKFIDRFTLLVLLFVLSMNMLIYFPHLMMLLLGWDGLGIVSFVLVIYYQNSKSLAAGMITALTNRIGDVMLLLAIAWTLNQGHWNIIHMWQDSDSFLTIQFLCITIAAMTKSAQMPFSSWLPAAMAAPTPVSALVHSSTLVTAGVFLLIRFYPFLSTCNLFCPFLLVISVCTTIMAGLSATTECDMKKIIALSTLSQLGFMMAALGLGMLNLAFFHMVTHAMFKALLFICAGTMIHSFSHSQDLRWMGNSLIQFPTTASCMMMANTALCGFPFMSGFYSKDLIIESSLFYPHNLIMMALIMAAVGLTSFYSTRFMLTTIWAPLNGPALISMTENKFLTQPMMILSFMSVMSGSFILWTFPMNPSVMVLDIKMKVFSLVSVMAGIAISWMLSTSSVTSSSSMMNYSLFHYASCLMWFLVPLSSQFIMKWPFYISVMFLKLVDQSWLEFFGGQGAMKYLNKSSNLIMEYQSYSPVNFLVMSLGLTFMILLILQL